MSRWTCSLYNRVEAVQIISSVIHCSNGTIWLKETVRSPDFVAVSLLPLTLQITRVMILHTVVEMISGMSLRTNKEREPCSGRKITESLGNVTVRGEKKMERARGEHDGQQSV
jgi:hypothetical protein